VPVKYIDSVDQTVNLVSITVALPTEEPAGVFLL